MPPQSCHNGWGTISCVWTHQNSDYVLQFTISFDTSGELPSGYSLKLGTERRTSPDQSRAEPVFCGRQPKCKSRKNSKQFACIARTLTPGERQEIFVPRMSKIIRTAMRTWVSRSGNHTLMHKEREPMIIYSEHTKTHARSYKCDYPSCKAPSFTLITKGSRSPHQIDIWRLQGQMYASRLWKNIFSRRQPKASRSGATFSHSTCEARQDRHLNGLSLEQSPTSKCAFKCGTFCGRMGWKWLRLGRASLFFS